VFHFLKNFSTETEIRADLMIFSVIFFSLNISYLWNYTSICKNFNSIIVFYPQRKIWIFRIDSSNWKLFGLILVCISSQCKS